MENNKIVFLFSGQGSQYRGMGQNLYRNNSVFKRSIEQSEVLVQKHLNRSLIDELYHNTNTTFDDLLITHPAIVAIEIAMYDVLISMGITPDYVCGNSLGEFASGVAGGIWDAVTAIEAAIEQAKSIVRSGIDGGMLIVLQQGDIKTISEYQDYSLFLASNNFNGHYTLSGTLQNIAAYESELMAREVQCVRLPVAAPFHSPLIHDGLIDFAYYTACHICLSSPKPGFISGIHYKALHTIEDTYFKDAVSQYSNYPKMVDYFEQKGPHFYIDVGPSGTSSTFVKYNLIPESTSKTFQIMTPFKRELQQLEALENLMKTHPRNV